MAKRPRSSLATKYASHQPDTDTFTTSEKAAMKERARELKAQARAGKGRAEGDKAVRDVLAKLPPADRTLGQRLHDLVASHAPTLVPKLWYGMPAYANSDGKPVCFFQAASKFGTRYATFAFTDSSALDTSQDSIWPTGFGLRSFSPDAEATIVGLIKTAVR